MNWEKYTSNFYIGNAVAQKLFLNLSTCFSISVVNAFIAKKIQMVMRCLFNTSKFITKQCETDNIISIWSNRLFRTGI